MFQNISGQTLMLMWHKNLSTFNIQKLAEKAISNQWIAQAIYNIKKKLSFAILKKLEPHKTELRWILTTIDNYTDMGWSHF